MLQTLGYMMVTAIWVQLEGLALRLQCMGMEFIQLDGEKQEVTSLSRLHRRCRSVVRAGSW